MKNMKLNKLFFCIGLGILSSSAFAKNKGGNWDLEGGEALARATKMAIEVASSHPSGCDVTGLMNSLRTLSKKYQSTPVELSAEERACMQRAISELRSIANFGEALTR